jgi:hypothetical protein
MEQNPSLSHYQLLLTAGLICPDQVADSSTNHTLASYTSQHATASGYDQPSQAQPHQLARKPLRESLASQLPSPQLRTPIGTGS